MNDNMVFLLTACVKSVSWLCNSERLYFQSTRSNLYLTVLLLGSILIPGCLSDNDWNEGDFNFQDSWSEDYHICYDSKFRFFDCHGFPEYLDHLDRDERAHRSYRWGDYGIENGDFLKIILTSHEDSSGMATVTVSTQDVSNSFNLHSGDHESRIFLMSGEDRFLEVTLQAENGWFGDIVHFTIELQIDDTYRDTDLDGYIDALDSCEYTFGTSSASQLGCLDSDNDTWSNSDEYSCGTSAYVWNQSPVDIDGDLICNYLDEDDDGDGWNDSIELTCGSDPQLSDSFPIVNETGECFLIQYASEIRSAGFWESYKYFFMILGTVCALLLFSNRTNNRIHEWPMKRYYEDYGSLTVIELKGLLRERGLPVSGKKGSLVARLEGDDVADAEADWFPTVFELEPMPNEIGHIRVSRNDVNQSVWIECKIGQTIGDAVASSGLVGRDGTPWSINDSSGKRIGKREQASRFWTQTVSVAFSESYPMRRHQ